MRQRIYRIRFRLRDEVQRRGFGAAARMVISYLSWRLRGRPVTGGGATLETWHRSFDLLRPPALTRRALISVVCPVYNTPQPLLQACIDSVRNQTYSNWELLLVDDASSLASTIETLHRAARDPRVRVLWNSENLGIAATTNRGIEEARGEYVAFLDHDDLLAPTALEWVAACISQEADLIYSDEDKVLEDGSFEEPFFKPAWSPRLLLSLNYVNHLLCVRASLLRHIGGLREGFDGAQDHDLLLRLAELPLTVAHLPNLLYHWRRWEGSTADVPSGKLQAEQSGLRAVQEALDRRGLEAIAKLGRGDPFRYRIHFLPDADLEPIKVVMPTRDRYKLLTRAIYSLAERTEGVRLHLVVVDNGSQEKHTLEFLRSLQRANPRSVTVQRVDDAFNFSRLCNIGAATGSDAPYLLFLNNDIEVLHGPWLVQLHGWLRDPEVVGVGPKLLYPDLKIQHAGVVLGMGGTAGHYSGHQDDEPRPGDLHDQAREVGCLTAACLLVRSEDFWKVGGFEEALAIDFQDVDFCLKLRAELEGVLMYDPTYPLVHHESASRGKAASSNRYTVSRLRFLWGQALGPGADPYYNPHLTLWKHDNSLAALPNDYAELLRRTNPRLIENKGFVIRPGFESRASSLDRA